FGHVLCRCCRFTAAGGERHATVRANLHHATRHDYTTGVTTDGRHFDGEPCINRFGLGLTHRAEADQRKNQQRDPHPLACRWQCAKEIDRLQQDSGDLADEAAGTSVSLHCIGGFARLEPTRLCLTCHYSSLSENESPLQRG